MGAYPEDSNWPLSKVGLGYEYQQGQGQQPSEAYLWQPGPCDCEICIRTWRLSTGETTNQTEENRDAATDGSRTVTRNQDDPK